MKNEIFLGVTPEGSGRFSFDFDAVYQINDTRSLDVVGDENPQGASIEQFDILREHVVPFEMPDEVDAEPFV